MATTPCSAQCPGKVDVPSYFSLIRDKKIDKAAEILPVFLQEGMPPRDLHR
jgi:NADPH-dependent glutamate synthase beta subunit-like oxidoreductase